MDRAGHRTATCARLFEEAARLHLQGRFGQAESRLRRLLVRDPASAPALNALGWNLRKQRRLVDAMLALRAAIALLPDWPAPRANLGMVLLQLGDYAEGWAQYEHRLADDPQLQPPIPAARWTGQPIAGRRILLRAEQGLGDTLQFCRYAPLLAAAGASQVDVVVQPALVSLLSSLQGVSAVRSELKVSAGDYDFEASLMSLPFAFRTTPETIPNATPYLRADAAKRAAWAARVHEAAGASLKVGIVWAGGSRPDDPAASAIDVRRSLTLEQIAPVLATPGITWFSLQKGAPSIDLPAFAGKNPRLRIVDASPELQDMGDTAALADCLDLVISCDTSVAHLAGALGKPVWVLNRYDLCWRWLVGRADSPWYPTARLFTQTRAGEWQPVIERVAARLRAVA